MYVGVCKCTGSVWISGGCGKHSGAGRQSAIRIVAGDKERVIPAPVGSPVCVCVWEGDRRFSQTF